MRFKVSIIFLVLISTLGFESFAFKDCSGEGRARSTPEIERASQVQADPEAELLRKPTGFDENRAFEHVRKQVEFGPRPAGSPAIDKLRDYLKAELESYGTKVTLDRFTAKTPLANPSTVEMANVIAELPGETDDIIIVASHYDTKLYTNFRFVGANDGGSSTGVLLEIARALAAKKPAERKIPHTVWFTFFDGEEAFLNWTSTDSTYGSRHMVSSLQSSGKLQKVKAMILLDMIGDAELVIPKEGQSTAWIADTITRVGRKIGYEANFPLSTHYIEDDHIPFLRAGVPAADLIDFSYGGPSNHFWHTSEDTLDKIGPKSLKAVGDTVIKALPKIAAQAK